MSRAEERRTSAPDPRPVFAALHNQAMRRAYAEVVLGLSPADDLGPSERRRVLAGLESAALIARDEDGWTATDAFGSLLGAAARLPRAKDITRFFTPDGRIDRFPSRAGERLELLALVAARAVQPGEDLPAPMLNERLARFTDDVPTLRRYLVDVALLDRTADGSSYRRVAEAVTSPDRPGTP